ncbi:glycine oxidase [Rhodoligotrophos appendicifer]|uniref:glycine oxidase ThiO n=1 Tax=Rhodoligotrophos appendicifer TaxID=987056 RepID=UPI001185B482|nr:glycine oxidase ThiO [Rhodoligotrophos appendicifer]
MTTITVIGAGVAGLTTALALAERGAAVEVVERGASLGLASCSRYAGGMLAPWCERESAEPLVLSLGREALDYWPRIMPDVVPHGTLVVAQRRDAAELDRFGRRTSAFETLSPDEIAKIEPALAGRFSRALFFRDESHLDPRRAVQVLAARLHALGVPIHLDTDGLSRRSGSDWLVDCRGLAARDVLGDLRGVKGEMLLVRCPEMQLSRPVRLLHPRIPFYVVPRGDGVFMLGATMIESSDRQTITARSLVEMLNSAYALHPAFAEAEILEIGTDARPAFPDNLPRIRVRDRTVFVNGLYRHGFLLAPALARMAAAVILDNASFPEVMDEDHDQRRRA